MDFVITKPVDYRKLADSVEAVMAARQPNPSNEAIPDGFVNLELMLQHRSALGEQQVNTLYGEAMDAAQARIASITESEPDNLTGIEDEAHALAGLCSNFGFTALGQLACNIETAAKSSLTDAVRENIDQLTAVARGTIDKLNSATAT